MDKHTATHTCTYDTHVDRMKDGKSRTLNKKSCGLVQPELYPSVSNVVFLSSGGIQKKQQKISFFKQNKSLGKEEEGGDKPHVQNFSQSLGKVEPETYYAGF